MARTGVQYVDIETAALELQGRGKVPTVDGIREVLGTGSKSTIAKYLREWKSEQTHSTGDLPPELAAVVSGLWQKIHSGADQRIKECSSNHEQEVLKLKETIEQAYQELSRANNELKQCKESLDIENEKNIRSQSTIQEKNLEITKTKEQLQASTQKLDDAQEENLRLHKLTQSMQKNLEHYQAEIHKQQVQQTLQTEKQHNYFVQEITSLKQHLSTLQNAIDPINKENDLLKLEITQIKDTFNKTQDSLTSANKENRTLSQEIATTNRMLDIANESANNANAQSSKLQKENAVLLDQKNRMQEELQITKSKLEKLMLASQE